MTIPTPNPEVQKLLDQARADLAEARAEKLREFPPNPHPFAQPDSFPSQFTPQQIAHRNALNTRIEELEKRVDELQRRLYSK